MAIHDFKSQRLFVHNSLGSNSAVEASREQANYLLNVMRLRDGSEILVFNGTDGEWLARIDVSGRKKCILVPLQQVREQPEPYSLVYCFAPLKQARLDYMIQKAVEMGAGVLQPVLTQYTQVRAINEKRVFANAVEAAEQCGIITLPKIREPVKIRELPDHLGPETGLVFCDEQMPNAAEIDNLPPASKRKIALLIGPEGGFSDEEREFLNAQPNVVRLGLGPRIMRADTAAVAALALINSKLGDWYDQNNDAQG